MNNLLEDLKKYYANLLIIQYNGKPKASETIKMLVKLMWTNMALMQIRDGFDWKTAVGEQLDIIGIWVGVDRHISKELYAGHSWFSLIEVNEGQNLTEDPPLPIPHENVRGGFAEISNFDTIEGGFLTEDLAGSYGVDLTDDNFRFLIGLKIIKNNISHFCKDIDDAIYRYTNGEIITQWDLINKKLIYKFPSNYEEIMEVAEIKKVLPCPPTCTIKLEENINV